MNSKLKLKRKRLLQEISPNVILLGVVSLLTDISSEMIHPLLPMFIVALGGGGMVVGLIGGLGDSLASILKVFAGFWSDRSGKRKPFIFMGYLLSSLSKIFLALCLVWQHIFVLRAVERVGKGLRTAPRDAIIADSTLKLRGKAFGLHRAMDTLGAIGGSAATFLLFYFLRFDFKPIFLLAGAVGISALIPLFWVKEKRKEARKISLKISLSGVSRPLRWFILVATLFALGNFSYMFFLLRIKEMVGDPRWSVALPVLYYIWFNAVYTAFSVPLGALSDIIGRKPVLILGYLLYGLVCLGFIWAGSWAAFVLLFALYGMVYASIDLGQRALASDLSGRDSRGIALGTFHTSIGLAALPANLVAGIFWQRVGPHSSFAYGAGMSGLAVLLFLIIGVEQRLQLRGKS
ncbi:MAG: MFS transporter [bacterium]